MLLYPSRLWGNFFVLSMSWTPGSCGAAEPRNSSLSQLRCTSAELSCRHITHIETLCYTNHASFWNTCQVTRCTIKMLPLSRGFQLQDCSREFILSVVSGETEREKVGRDLHMWASGFKSAGLTLSRNSGLNTYILSVRVCSHRRGWQGGVHIAAALVWNGWAEEASPSLVSSNCLSSLLYRVLK